MTYPQQGYPQPGYQQGPPPQSYPQQPAPQYQQGPPMAPQGYQQPPQQYAPQPGYGYPPAGPAQYGPPQPQAELPSFGLDDFLSQPTTGIKAWSFSEKSGYQLNMWRQGLVARAITDADVQVQTQPGSNTPQTYADGRFKLRVDIPLNVAMDHEFQDGRAVMICGKALWEEVQRAMAAAGAPAGVWPEVGATIWCRKTGYKQARNGMNPAGIYEVQYVRPENAQNGAPVAAPSAQPATQPAQAPAPEPVQQAPAQPQGSQPGQWGVPAQAAPPAGPQGYPQQPQYQQPAPPPAQPGPPQGPPASVPPRYAGPGPSAPQQAPQPQPQYGPGPAQGYGPPQAQQGYPGPQDPQAGQLMARLQGEVAGAGAPVQQ